MMELLYAVPFTPALPGPLAPSRLPQALGRAECLGLWHADYQGRAAHRGRADTARDPGAGRADLRRAGRADAGLRAARRSAGRPRAPPPAADRRRRGPRVDAGQRANRRHHWRAQPGVDLCRDAGDERAQRRLRHRLARLPADAGGPRAPAGGQRQTGRQHVGRGGGGLRAGRRAGAAPHGVWRDSGGHRDVCRLHHLAGADPRARASATARRWAGPGAPARPAAWRDRRGAAPDVASPHPPRAGRGRAGSGALRAGCWRRCCISTSCATCASRPL